jgi:hypothetical protein
MLAASQENDVTQRHISTRFREFGRGTKLGAAGNRRCSSDLSAGRAKTEHPANAEIQVSDCSFHDLLQEGLRKDLWITASCKGFLFAPSNYLTGRTKEMHVLKLEIETY